MASQPQPTPQQKEILKMKNIYKLYGITIVEKYNKKGELLTVNIGNEYEIAVSKYDEYGNKANQNYLEIFQLHDKFVTINSHCRELNTYNGNNTNINIAIDSLAYILS